MKSDPNVNCTADEIKQAAGGYLGTEEIIFNTNKTSNTVADLVRTALFLLPSFSLQRDLRT